MTKPDHERFHIMGWLVLVLTCCLTGCGLFEELLPTSSDRTDAAPGTGSESSPPSSSTGSSPTSPSPYPAPTTGVSAPEIDAPPLGGDVTEAQPTLVVANSATGDKYPLTYSFELARDEAFEDMVASVEDVAQGSGGRTAWQVPQPLAPEQYFWRARAKAGFVKSLYSPVADFTVLQQAQPPEPGGGVAEVIDPLTDGASLGEVHGGVFTSQGWKVTSRSDFIRYEIEPHESGFVEWENTGLQPSNPSPDQYMLFGMWDPTRGDYRANPFRVHIQKLDTNHNPPYVRLRWIADGEQHDEGYNFTAWDPDDVFQWRIEWGPSGSSNEARVMLNGQVIIQVSYTPAYKPQVHWVELGIEERVESIVGVIYSNVRIGSR